MKNLMNRGFTLIELIMVTIILGILAAVSIPRYMSTVDKAEQAAEDAVISAMVSGLQIYATEKLIDSGRRYYPSNPFDALAKKPLGYDSNDSDDADSDDEWTFNTSTNRITHMRKDGSKYYWNYDAGTNTEIIIPNTDCWSGTLQIMKNLAAVDNGFIQAFLQIRNPSVVMEKHFSGASSQDHQQIIMITAVIMVTVLSMVLTACHAAIAEDVLVTVCHEEDYEPQRIGANNNDIGSGIGSSNIFLKYN